MKMKIYRLILCVLMIGILTTCKPAASGSTNLSEQDAGKTIELRTGDTLVIALDGNITTGYNWIPAAQEPALLKQVGDTEATPESSLVGAPGKIVLKFQAAAKGQAILRLDYKRPWEQNTPPAKTFEVTVVVK